MGKRSFTPFGAIVVAVSCVFSAAATATYFMYESPEPVTITNENGEEVILPKGPEAQETASIWKDVAGRDYLLWEGHVVEEPDNSMEENGRVSVSYDADIYNFDLGIIIHGGYLSDRNSSVGDGLSRTTFNELADKDGNLPTHIERVKQIGCEIAQEYFDRHSSGEYQETPEDVIVYHQRHCDL